MERIAAAASVSAPSSATSRASIDSGVSPGEIVVVDGSDRLRDGAKAEVPDGASRAAAAEGSQKGGKGERRRKSGE